jgi:hypothetical protein
MASYGYDSEYTGIRKLLNPQDPKARVTAVVVLAAAGAALLWYLIGFFFSSGGNVPVVSDDWNVTCVKCDAESVISRSDFAKQARTGAAAQYPDCPKCQQTVSCVETTVCPECDKRFASDAAKALLQAASENKTIDQHAIDIICPKCKHDLKGSVSHE